jgi:adenine deaminase
MVLTNVQIVDVFRLRVFSGWVAIQNGRFRYVEEGGPPAELESLVSQDLGGAYIIPGLIDTHMHIESSLVLPHTFAEAVLPQGTTAVLADAHEIANVSGEQGIRWFMNIAVGLPLNVFFAVPSVVPTISAPVETPNAELSIEAIKRLCADPRVLSIGEVHDYRGVAKGEARLVKLGDVSLQTGLKIEGHIPDLTGTDLSRYVSLGATSDHTLTRPDKIMEEMSKGLYVMLQRKSVTKDNIEAIMALPDRSRVLFVTDDVAPSEIRHGHLLSIVKGAIDLGLPWLEAIASATIRPATYLGLHRMGAIAPGRQADFWVADHLEALVPRQVYVAGRCVADNGEILKDAVSKPKLDPLPANTPPIPGPFTQSDFCIISASPDVERAKIRAIDLLNDENTLAGLAEIELEIAAGYPIIASDEDLSLIGVVSRVNPSSRAVALLKGFGLRSGACASSFAHDAHNLLVIGCDPLSIVTAANEVHRLNGGLVFATGREIEASLPLPIMGLLSNADLRTVVRRADSIETALRIHGVHHQRPLLTLTFMALSSSPYFKMSDRGIVDVERRELLSPVVALEEPA